MMDQRLELKVVTLGEPVRAFPCWLPNTAPMLGRQELLPNVENDLEDLGAGMGPRPGHPDR